MISETTIIIADDHPVLRKGLRAMIEAVPGMKVLGEAADGESALRLIRELRPSVAILDIEMPVRTGLDVARILQAEEDPVAIVFLTMYKEEDMFDEAMDLGVRGYVLKESAPIDIIDSIRCVAGGHHYISPQISGFLVSRQERSKSFRNEIPGLDALTATELRILKLIADNKTSKEIADDLNVSYKTVENHRTNIASKLNFHGAHALLKFALQNKSLVKSL